MYFSLKSDCYFRRYGSIGHIIRPIISKEEVVDTCGAIFIEQLQYYPQSINEIGSNLINYFEGVDPEQLRQDALNFYLDLAQEDFLNSSGTLDEFENTGFQYSTLEGKLAYKYFHVEADESSAHFLGEYFKKNPFLQTFHVELTSKCNERCIHCYIPHEKKDTEIEYDLMIEALNQCKELGVLTIVFSGGEPMLHPHFCKFLHYAKDLDFNVTILSNLTLLNDKILEALKYRHASCVNVSLYSMCADVHDSITTVKGSFEITKKNILKLIENGIPVQINCPIMKQNKDSFYDVVDWGQDHKCSVVTDYLIMARSDHSKDNLSNRLSPDELASVIENLMRHDLVLRSNIAVKVDDINSEAEFDTTPDDRVCGVGMSTLCMVASGEVYPCAGWQKYVCGNLREETLRQIWENSDKIKYLRSLRQKDFSKCIQCKDRDYCLMCMSRNSNEDIDGNIFNIPPITCDAAHIYHETVKKFKSNLRITKSD